MGKDKEKKAKASDQEAEDVVLEYLQKQNRPYNAIMLYENLHGAVGKTQAVKILQELADKGIITSKEFGKQKLFWRKQEELSEFDAGTLKKLDEQIAELDQRASELSDHCKSLSNELRLLHNAPTDEEASSRVKLLSVENDALRRKVDSIKSNQRTITSQEREQAEKEYDFTKLAWKKRKRMCRDICGHIEEGSGKRFRDIKDELLLEVDDDFGVSVDQDDETTKLKKGELIH